MPENKPVHAPNVPTPADRPRRLISHEQIVERAERLWRERGSPTGQDVAIWLEAESQLQSEAEARPVSGTASRPYTDEPAQPVRRQTKSRDPADMAAQTRSATERQSKQNGGKRRSP